VAALLQAAACCRVSFAPRECGTEEVALSSVLHSGRLSSSTVV
jgi:hypothetical protein